MDFEHLHHALEGARRRAVQTPTIEHCTLQRDRLVPTYFIASYPATPRAS